MRKLYLYGMAVVTALTFSACTNAGLSPGKAKRIVKKEMSRTHSDIKISPFVTGYYELNDDDARYKLRCLAAAGVIDYKAERIKTKRNVETGYDWWAGRYTYSSVTRSHYFVSVSLTKAGQKCLEQMPDPKTLEDKDMISAERGEFPEDKVAYEEVFPEDATATAPQTTPDTTPDTAEKPAEEPGGETAPAPSKTEKSPYELAIDKVKADTCSVLEFKIRPVLVRKLVVLPNTQTASGECILEIHDVTPFGRILTGVHDGLRQNIRISLIYHQGEGWKLDE